MVAVNYARRIESGGAFGYFDGYPTGEIPGTGLSAAFASGLNNTWIVSKDLGGGSK